LIGFFDVDLKIEKIKGKPIMQFTQVYLLNAGTFLPGVLFQLTGVVIKSPPAS
jgi:hypothetical protein